MARTQAADYDQRRADIVNRAARIYARSSFLGASIADLASACKVSKSAIYHYYKSKEDILFDIMLSHMTVLEAAARGIASEPGQAAQKLRKLSIAFMEAYAEAADHQKVLLNELEHLPKPRRARIVATQRGLIEIVEGLLAEIEPRLHQRAGRLRAAAMLFFGMINWAHTWFDPKGPVSAEEFANMAADVALGGFANAARS